MADGNAAFVRAELAGENRPVAEFLAQARLDGATARDSAAFARAVADAFAATYDLDTCTPAQLMQIGEFAARGGALDLARAALARAAASGENIGATEYRRGRLELSQQNAEAARAHFADGTVREPDFPYNWVGLARALYGLGRKHEAAQAGERFAAFGVRPHAVSDFTMLADLGDYRFDSGDRRGSLPLYALVVRFGAGSPRDAVRLAEAHLTAGDPAAAQRVLEAQQKRAPLDPWGRRALASACSLLGEHGRAVELAESVAAAHPTNQGFAGTYVDVLVRAGDPERLRVALEGGGPALAADAAAELSVRLKLADGEIEAAIGVLLTAPIAVHSRLYFLIFEASYRALDAGRFDQVLALNDRLAALQSGDPFVKLLRIDVFFRQQMWEQAAAVLDGMTEEEAAHPNALLKRFELACFVGDSDRAMELCARLEALNMPDRQFMLPVFRYLAERRAWNELVDRALPWLHPLFDYAQIGYVLFRAAKHTGRQAEMAAAIEAIEAWQARPGLARLRAEMLCDIAVTIADIDALERDPAVWGEPRHRQRLEARRNVLRRAQRGLGRRAVFFCTDRNYLCATIVALHGALACVDLPRTDFFVVVDDDLAALCRDAVAPLAELGAAITVVPAAEVVESAGRLFPAYGLFTSGHSLASAAYYRIYFARHLQRLGEYDRAIYLDSDVIVRGSLQDLFDIDLAGHPIGARNEVMRPEVRRAIELHGLADGRYFNSGVLVFDLKHDRLAAGLDGAVGAIMDDETTLLYHDQCALNLGFRGDAAEIGLAWNQPVQESHGVDDIAAEAAVLHFLDRPKPWSAAYGGAASALWFECWRRTAAAIGDAMAASLLEQSQD